MRALRAVCLVLLAAALPCAAQWQEITTAWQEVQNGVTAATAVTAGDGLSSATCTPPLACTLAAKALSTSIAVTPANPGGAFALQGAFPATQQTGNGNISGTFRAGTALYAGWNGFTGLVPGTLQAAYSGGGYAAVNAGNITAQALATPSITSVTPQTAGGGVTYTYKIVHLMGEDPGQHSAASAAVSTADGAADLSAPNSGNTLIWGVGSGSSTTLVYRIASGGLPASTGLIATITDPTVVTYLDAGAAGNGATPASTNTTGIVAGATLSTTGSAAIGYKAFAKQVIADSTTGGTSGGGTMALAASAGSPYQGYLLGNWYYGGSPAGDRYARAGSAPFVLFSVNDSPGEGYAAGDIIALTSPPGAADAAIAWTARLWLHQAGGLSLQNGASPEKFTVYNSFVGGVSDESASLDWSTTANVFHLTTRYTGTGSPRPMVFGGGSVQTDVAPQARYVQGQSAWSQATVNTAGQDLSLAGGLGRRFLSILLNTGLATKTFTFVANGTTYTLTAVASGAGAHQFNVGSDDTAPQVLVTATNLANAIIAETTLTGLVTPTVVADVSPIYNVFLDKTPTLNSLTLSTNAAGTVATATNGPDGNVAVPGVITVSGIPATTFTTFPASSTKIGYIKSSTGWTGSGVLFSEAANTAFSLVYGGDVAYFGKLTNTSYATWFTSSSAGLASYPLLLTAGTMTATVTGRLAGSSHKYTWTNAMVTALGAVLSGDVKVCTLPAKTRVKNVYVVITGAGAVVDTLTVAVGRTGATYIDYIVASNAMAAANTLYGAVSGERGTNLTGYDLPSFTGTTDVYAHFVATSGSGKTLADVTGSTGSVYIETELLP